jgi:hypothetical protein
VNVKPARDNLDEIKNGNFKGLHTFQIQPAPGIFSNQK